MPSKISILFTCPSNGIFVSDTFMTASKTPRLISSAPPFALADQFEERVKVAEITRMK